VQRLGPDVAAGLRSGGCCGLGEDRDGGGRGQAAVAPQTLIWAGAVRIGMGGPLCGKPGRALVFPVLVPVPVYLDAAAGQGGQDAAAVGGDQAGGQAGGRRAGPGRGDDGAAGGGEGDLARVDGLAGAAAPAGRDGDRGGGAGGSAGQFGGDHPGGVLLGGQGRGVRAEHRPGGGPGAGDRGLGFLQRGFRAGPPPVAGGRERLGRLSGMPLLTRIST
jgi:hypothetical protein